MKDKWNVKMIKRTNHKENSMTRKNKHKERISFLMNSYNEKWRKYARREEGS